MESDSEETKHLTREQLLEWLQFEDGQGDPELEAHLESCEQCSKLLESLSPESQLSWKSINVGVVPGMMKTLPVDMEQDSEVAEPRPKYASRWTLLKQLTAGGIGEIWIARDELLFREVAVKRLKRETASKRAIQRRFIHEARITAQLNHPGVVDIFDLVEDGSKSYYAMSLIHGQTLLQHIEDFHSRKRSSRFNARGKLIELLRIWSSVARTIAFAHSEGVLHRDIKSENIIVGEYGEVTVIDWGIAKRISDRVTNDPSLVAEESRGKNNTQVRQTRLGTRLGTPAFMSPEQARGDVEAIDERSDNYSLASMLYEILTGRTPFNAETVQGMIEAVLYDHPVPPKDYCRLVDNRLSQICLRGLSRDPEERFQLASEFADAIDEWADSETHREQSDRSRQKLFDLSTDLMLMFDSTPKIVWVNAAWERLLGWRSEDLLGLKPNVLVHPEDLERDNEVFREVQRGTTVNNIQRRLQSSDGCYRWFSWTVTPLVDEEVTVAVGRDIDALVRRKDELAELLEATPEAIFVLNPDQTIHRVNQRLLKMFGYLEVELVGRSILNLAPKQSRGTMEVLFNNYQVGVEQQTVVQREQLLGRHKDGHKFPINIRLRRYESGQTPRIVGTVRTISRSEDFGSDNFAMQDRDVD